MLPGDQIWSELEPRLKAIHGSVEPVVVAQSRLGPDEGGPPLARIVAYPATEPSPHWHFVTCGLSASRFISGYPAVGDLELTFRLGREKAEKAPPQWVAEFLQQLSRDAFSDDGPVAVEKQVELEPFWQGAHDTALTAGFYIEDPVVPAGPIRLVQLVALTAAERGRVVVLATDRSKLVLELAPSGISDLSRERPAAPVPRAAPRADAPVPLAAPRPASPPPEPKFETVAVSKTGARMRLSIGSAEVAAFIEAVKASVLFGRVTCTSQGWTVLLSVDDIPRSATWATTLAIFMTVDLSKKIASELGDPARRGTALHCDGLPDLELFVTGEAPDKGSLLKKIGGFFGIP
jgi:hypothetical protein